MMQNSNIKNMQKRGDIEGLVKALQNDDPQIRKFVAKALLSMKCNEVIERLIGLFSGDFFYAVVAANILQNIGDAAVEPLISNLTNKNKDVVGLAASTLAAIKDERAIQPLVGLLKSRQWENRDAAVTGLERMGGKRAIDALIGAVKDRHWMVRIDAISALSELNSDNDDRIITAIKSALDDKDPNVRIVASNALLEEDQQHQILLRQI